MSVEIRVEWKKKPSVSFSPSLLWGAGHGEVYQQRSHGELQESYLVGAGGAENPISIWFDTDSRKYRLSSETVEDLKSYLSHIDYVHCPDARLEIALHLTS